MSSSLTGAAVPDRFGDDPPTPRTWSSAKKTAVPLAPIVSVGTPACTNCRVPMNLCHCSTSECSECKGTKELCKCISVVTRPPAKPTADAPPPPPPLPLPCTKCAEVKGQLAACERVLAGKDKETTKELAQRDKELEKIKAALTESRTQEQREREGRVSDKGCMAKRIAELEWQLREAQRHVSREAELVRARDAALQQAVAADARRMSAEANGAKVREELQAVKDCVAASDAAARVAEESRLAHVAEATQASECERTLRAELAATSEKIETLRRQAAEHPGRAGRVERAEALLGEALRGKAALEAELVEAKEQLKAGAKATELDELEATTALAHEQAENRRLQALLAEVQAQGRQTDGASASQVAALEKRIETLTAENAQLAHHVKHAEHLRSLFRTVTSRTHEVQEAANSVIKQVEASKQARTGHESARQPSTSAQAPSASAPAPWAGKGPRPSTSDVDSLARAGAPLGPSNINYVKVPVPPSGPKAPRLGGTGRPSVRS